MLRQTGKFYEQTRAKLDEELDGILYKTIVSLQRHLGRENNYYLESIEKKISIIYRK